MAEARPGMVCDAQPLIALLAGEPSATRIRSELARRADSGGLMMSAVNWCEVLYVVRRRSGREAAALAAARMQEAGIGIVDADANIASFASVLKADHGLGLGDSFAAALALALGLPLMTGDSDFLALGGSGLTIVWVG